MIYLEEHFFEQYFTLSQLSLHFFLQLKGLLQTGQVFFGKLAFFIVQKMFIPNK